MPDRAALTGILFVLKSGIPWEMLPAEMGCGSGMTCWRRLRDWHKVGVWQSLHEAMLAQLEAAHLIDWGRASVDGVFIRAKGAKGGPVSQAVGPSPVDRGRAGTKRHQAVDKNGLPLAALLSGANVPDGRMLLAVVDAIPLVRGASGAVRAVAPGRFTPTKPTTTGNCGGGLGGAGSRRALPGGGLSAPTVWAAAGGWPSARSAGSRGRAAFGSGTSVATTSTRRSSSWRTR